MGMSGTFHEIAPPGRLVHSEIFDDDWTGGEAIVTTTLVDRGATTLLTVTMLYTSKAARDAALETNFVTGMELGYNVLAEVLAADRDDR
jgi:uncharacterized protein YndB with AHSA1/START domain